MKGKILQCSNSNCVKELGVVGDKVYYAGSTCAEKIPSSIRTNFEKANSWRKSNFSFYKEEFSMLLNQNVLDIGTGRGHFLDIFNRNNHVICLDYLPYGDVDIVVNYVNGIPLKSESFDVVVLSNVLEHTFDVAQLISEVTRVLKPGGVILGTVPFLTKVHQKPFDFHRLTVYALEKYFSSDQYSLVEITPLNSVFDVFMQNVKTFFSLNTSIHYRLVYRLVQKFLFSFLKIFEKILSTDSPINSDFTLGYSFKINKK